MNLLMSTLALLPLLYPAAPLHAVEEELKLPPMHHAVKMVVPQGMKIDPQVRLNEQDEIDCISCHGIEDIAEIPLEEIDSKSDDFFVDGPYPTMGALCARCHNSNESERTNIHILLDKDGKLIEDRCTFCHMEVPDTQAEVVAGESRENTGESTRENAALRLPAQKLCFGCHLKTPHINADNHLVEISNESSNAMPGEMVDHLKQESEKSGYRLPLSEGHITCITCHTSHQRGVIKPKLNEQEQVEDRSLEDGVGYADHPWGKVVAADRRVRIDELVTQSSEPPLSPKLLKEQLQYRRLTHEVLLRAPAKDGTLCLLCHSFEK